MDHDAIATATRNAQIAIIVAMRRADLLRQIAENARMQSAATSDAIANAMPMDADALIASESDRDAFGMIAHHAELMGDNARQMEAQCAKIMAMHGQEMLPDTR